MSALVTALALGLTTVAAATGPAPAAASWEPVHRQSQTFLDGVTTTGPEHVWAVGSQLATDGFYRPAALRTVDGVTTQLPPVPADYSTRWGRFLSVDGVADDDMWAVGLFVAKTSGTTIPLLAHWNGTAWQQVRLPLPPRSLGELVSVSARATDDVWFAGTMDGVSTARLYHWDGTRVLPVAVTIKDPLCFEARATVTALTVTAEDVWLGLRCGLTTDAREEGSVQRLHNGAWRLAVVLPPSSGILGLADNGAGVVWAVGTQSTASGFESVAYAGRTTMSLAGTFGSNELYWAVAAQGQQVYLVGQIAINNTPIVMRRSGPNWLAEPVDGDQPLFGVTIDPAGTAFAVGPTFGGSFGTPHAGLWRRTV